MEVNAFPAKIMYEILYMHMSWVDKGIEPTDIVNCLRNKCSHLFLLMKSQFYSGQHWSQLKKNRSQASIIQSCHSYWQISHHCFLLRVAIYLILVRTMIIDSNT